MKTSDRKIPEGATRDLLVAAAAAAFNRSGFHGTDTNRIAREAGFAPQTFYRHFPDKLAIFLAVYEDWERQGAAGTNRAAREPDPDAAIADAIIAHHCAWAGFRRSLRLLASENEAVRAVRNAGRMRQITALRRTPAQAASDATLLAALLVIERLADAVADGEWADFGVTAEDARAQMVAAVRKARAPG